MGAKNNISGLMFRVNTLGDKIWNKFNVGMKAKLLILFLIVKILPLILLAAIAWKQFVSLGDILKETAVDDSTKALNNIATDNIERLTTDVANSVAAFLYERDNDILYLSKMPPSANNFREFLKTRTGNIIDIGTWIIADDGMRWVQTNKPAADSSECRSTNKENDDRNGFRYRGPDNFPANVVPLYDEITFIGLDGAEIIKVTAGNSTKKNYPMNRGLRNVSRRENTYIKAETYFAELRSMKPGEIYVSDVIGAYVGSNFIGMYTPKNVQSAAQKRGYKIPFEPEQQAYAGMENPTGQRFEGIVRWAAPVAGADGSKIGYVSFALNHDHIMEFVDRITPMSERYIQTPSAFDGNYAFIWDYNCRSICHPRHNSIVGYDPGTGEPQVPWLEQSIYDEWQKSGKPYSGFIKDIKTFDSQSRRKAPSAELTKQGFVGLDGRYLNNAPQCTGWMDLTRDGGSGSFYILWSGLYKLTTAAAIPYYTGQYAPGKENNFSKRGFAFVTIGAGLDDFTKPAQVTGEQLEKEIEYRMFNTGFQLVFTTLVIIGLVVIIAFWMALFLTNNIERLNAGIARFRSGERQFRFRADVKDEFGMLADSFDDMADSIVDSVKSPLEIIDMEQRVIYMNAAGLRYIGKTLEAIAGMPYVENSISPCGSLYDPISALQKTGEEAQIYYHEGEDSYLKGSANYLLDKNDNRIGYIIIFTDVTPLVKAQLELERAIGEVNKANEHKGEFLARMSHEIRTPMNAIIGLTSIVKKKIAELKESGGAEDIKSQIQKIENSSQHLLGLLNDILDISKIDAGKIELSSDTMVLPKLISTVKEIIKPRCDEKNIAFNLIYDEFEPKMFLSDSLRLRQVLINLLGNAVKFTPEYGTIKLAVEKIGEAGGKSNLRFSVKDTGIGISPERLNGIFEPFEQENRDTSKKYGGTGLGLAISRRIVELFGGGIQVDSVLGEGSEFSFVIWLEDLAGGIVPDAAAVDTKDMFKGFRALLVDDVEINRLIVTSILETTGITMDEAADGNAAVSMFENSPNGTYDIILMDVQMPLMDGYEASTVIRNMQREDAKTVPIIALTANAFKDDIDRAIKHGMNAHVAKPIEMDKLIEVLFKYLSKPAS
ncbi:MAG: response regulator [Spirochaetia bacterium]|jgi:signal transduction histidine kinase/ActR/RegA family two-component response regulator|nr:response regulator [Spirochaetia bacterium]